MPNPRPNPFCLLALIYKTTSAQIAVFGYGLSSTGALHRHVDSECATFRNANGIVMARIHTRQQVGCQPSNADPRNSHFPINVMQCQTKHVIKRLNQENCMNTPTTTANAETNNYSTDFTYNILPRRIHRSPSRQPPPPATATAKAEGCRQQELWVRRGAGCERETGRCPLLYLGVRVRATERDVFAGSRARRCAADQA